MFRALRLLTPNSISGLMAVACLITALPLLLALVLASTSLDRVARLGEDIVLEGVAGTRLGLELRDGLVDLERNARQYDVLGAKEMRKLMQDRLRGILLTLGRMEAAPSYVSIDARAQEIRRQIELAQRRALRANDNSPSPIPARDVRQLVNTADEIIEVGRAEIQAQTNELTSASASARQVIWISTGGLVPLALLLVFIASAMISRPIRSLGRGIQALGDGDYQAGVSVQFPQEARELADRLNWLGERLQQYEDDKDRFLRSVSHELKTPLASLREGADLLAGGALGSLSKSQQEVADILRESASDLGSLIINLLSFAEWRSERRIEAPEWFEVEPMLEEMFRTRLLTMNRRGLAYDLNLPSPKLFGQKRRIREALDNLVGNAVRYAPENSSVDVRCAIEDGHCVLAVRDYGRGVENDEMETIFEPFVKGAQSEQPGVRGTGIGLSIVRDAARAHGGAVHVENANPGARFVLSWSIEA